MKKLIFIAFCLFTPLSFFAQAFYTGDIGQFTPVINQSKPVQSQYLEDSTAIKNFFLYTVLPYRYSLYQEAFGYNFVQWLESNPEEWYYCLSYGTIKNSGIQSDGHISEGSDWTGHCISVKNRRTGRIILLAKYANFYNKPLKKTDNYCYNANNVGNMPVPGGNYNPPAPIQCSLGTGVITASANMITFDGMTNVLKVIVDGFEFVVNRNVTASFNHSLTTGPHVAYYYCDNATFKAQQSFVVASPTPPTPPAPTCNLSLRTSKSVGDSTWIVEVDGGREVNSSRKLDFVFSWGNNEVETVPSVDGKATFTAKVAGEVSVKVFDRNIPNGGCSIGFFKKNLKPNAPIIVPPTVFETEITLDNLCSCKEGDLTFSGPVGSKLILKPMKEGKSEVIIKSGETKSVDLRYKYNYEVKLQTTGEQYTVKALGDGANLINTEDFTIDVEKCRKCRKSGIGWWIAGGSAAAILTTIILFAVGNGG